MDLAVVLVHYHAAELARQAIAALQEDLAGSGWAVEWLVVDNGSDAAGGEILASLPVQMLDPGRNLGYAGGINLGVARSSAPWIVALNPDVLVEPGCSEALVGVLAGGIAVAGPRFYWDRGHRFLLPPTERRDFTSELASRLAGRGDEWARWARRRWRRHARRHWRADAPLGSYSLSGALLALRRDAWEAIGPFDERFRLYFEETDWLVRLSRSGRQARYVPRARAVHLYNRSAAQEPKAKEWFSESRNLFQERHYGRLFGRLLRWAERKAGPRLSCSPPLAVGGQGVPPELRLDRPSRARAGRRWIEISPNAVGFPAAAELLAPEQPRWSLPDEIWRPLTPGEYTIRVVDDAGREIESWSFVR